MTNNELTQFDKTQNSLIQSLLFQREELSSKLDVAKEQYKLACNLFGDCSKQAGQCDKLVCAMQTAIKVFDELCD